MVFRHYLARNITHTARASRGALTWTGGTPRSAGRGIHTDGVGSLPKRTPPVPAVGYYF